MLVSIITVSYNSAATISRTIESVCAQTYPEIEYIIVDGASPDGTLEIIKKYETAFAEKGFSYRYVSEPDNGMYDAMNKGIQMAQGELIGIINSDDWYEPCAASHAAEYFLQENYDLFYADLRIVGEKDSFIKKARDGRIITSRYWNHPTTFIPKRVYERFAYRNETIHDDWDLILRIRKAGAKVCIDNTVLANFTRNGVSHEKSLKKAFARAKIKYGIYRANHYSRWYALECYGMELAKLIL